MAIGRDLWKRDKIANGVRVGRGESFAVVIVPNVWYKFDTPTHNIPLDVVSGEKEPVAHISPLKQLPGPGTHLIVTQIRGLKPLNIAEILQGKHDKWNKQKCAS